MAALDVGELLAELPREQIVDVRDDRITATVHILLVDDDNRVIFEHVNLVTNVLLRGHEEVVQVHLEAATDGPVEHDKN